LNFHQLLGVGRRVVFLGSVQVGGDDKMTEFNQEAFEALQGKVMGDVGGAMGLLMAYLGDQAGVYEGLEAHGPCSHAQLAEVTGLDARYLREWLSANAAHGYVEYDQASDQFSITPEQAAIFAHDGEPTCMQGFFQAVVSQYATHDTALDVFQSGRGRPWAEHDACCFCGTDRFFRPATWRTSSTNGSPRSTAWRKS
jgi:hypothetical protein